MTDRPSPRRRDAQPLSGVGGSPVPSGPTRRTKPTFLTAGELVDLTGGRLVRSSERPVRGAAVDSRQVRPGELFVALPGERTDGHRYLGDAVRAGAAALLVTRPPDPDELAALGDVSVVLVDDAVRGLGAIAA
ncbi:MAG TPA: Mur ligase domain-containing protein, partial [Candidatus Sulfomarinibacteraceae bacterium]|nr:Mur ligase domain-containing protein [Candidatus Sulfomarinibacteraceae bacterium]